MGVLCQTPLSLADFWTKFHEGTLFCVLWLGFSWSWAFCPNHYLDHDDSPLIDTLLQCFIPNNVFHTVHQIRQKSSFFSSFICFVERFFLLTIKSACWIAQQLSWMSNLKSIKKFNFFWFSTFFSLYMR